MAEDGDDEDDRWEDATLLSLSPDLTTPSPPNQLRIAVVEWVPSDGQLSQSIHERDGEEVESNCLNGMSGGSGGIV